MSNVKNGKLVSSSFVGSKFGEGAILEPTRTANDQGGGGGCASSLCACCGCCNYSGGSGSGSGSGCGSSNKIQVYQV